ncbi:hypothetical protein [Epilithonimonas xixisoli]|uniref:Uncharacterized protein n=1 Tax=Epilithonimonas xixisoli TaxID=1476462 RepID=A0A4R8IDJ0_9FLAO|nr:hypothetical protein [Epilithonimonas xixisoli]TDX82835.1 hypothetical protein B0I22_2869 [Epilithonimonas xixisoli]
MIDLGKLYIPTLLDYNPETQIICFAKPEFGSDDYIYNLECSLTFSFSGTDVFIDYYCDNDTYLSENLGCHNGCIIVGDLEIENFESIQRKALVFLSKFMNSPDSEILNDYI